MLVIEAFYVPLSPLCVCNHQCHVKSSFQTFQSWFWPFISNHSLKLFLKDLRGWYGCITVKVFSVPSLEYSPSDSYRCIFPPVTQTSFWMRAEKWSDFTSHSDWLTNDCTSSWWWPRVRLTCAAVCKSVMIMLSSELHQDGRKVSGRKSDAVWALREAGCFLAPALNYGSGNTVYFKCVCCTTAEFRVLSQGLGNHADGVLHDQNHSL